MVVPSEIVPYASEYSEMPVIAETLFRLETLLQSGWKKPRTP